MSLKQTRAVVMHRWNIKCLTDLLNRSEILVFVSSIYLASKGWLISEQCSICTKINQSIGVLFMKVKRINLLHFVASLLSTGVDNEKVGVDNEKVGVDNEKSLELTNSTVFLGVLRQWKSSRAGQQNIFFIFEPDFNEELSPKNATKHPVA